MNITFIEMDITISIHVVEVGFLKDSDHSLNHSKIIFKMSIISKAQNLIKPQANHFSVINVNFIKIILYSLIAK